LGKIAGATAFPFFGYVIEKGKTVALFPSADIIAQETVGGFSAQLSVQIFSKDICV
jgi:hypothetical protein